MEVRFSSIVRNTLTQVNFSISTKDPEDSMKNMGVFINIMADLPYAARITMLLSEFHRSDHYLCLSYFQPRDPADLTYEKMITDTDRGVSCALPCHIFILGLQSPCHAEFRLRLLSLLDKKPDVKKSPRRPESAGGLLTASVQLERT
ncbi:hypothetical protein ACTXT7_008394 [Hymenolepis weldensis]